MRHGEATHNVDARERGGAVAYLDPRHFNSELTPRGKAQARLCTLPGRPDIAVTSPLRRAVQTAHIALIPHQGVPLVILDCLREFPNGRHTPNRLFRSQDTWRADEEETRQSLFRRVEAFLQWVHDVKHLYTKIAVFGHTSFLEALLGRSAAQPLPHAQVVPWTLAHEGEARCT